jgi:hypothetical protein
MSRILKEQDILITGLFMGKEEERCLLSWVH